MAKILVTSFLPYDEFAENASLSAMQLAEAAWQDHAPSQSGPSDAGAGEEVFVEWHRLPVDFDAVPKLLAELWDNPNGVADAVLHIGQAPGANRVQIETRGVNERFGPHDDSPSPLLATAGDEYASDFLLAGWVDSLASRQLPVALSHDAGRYLCNAALFYSLHFFASLRRMKHATFLHVPLLPEQAEPLGLPSLPAETSAEIVTECVKFAKQLFLR